jgi:hypothetical protein
MKFLKVGRVAIITRGRYAGKKVRFHNLHCVLSSPGVGGTKLRTARKFFTKLEIRLRHYGRDFSLKRHSLDCYDLRASLNSAELKQEENKHRCVRLLT